jgi:acid stress-induced BolA-like protein IbaG/YrbA
MALQILNAPGPDPRETADQMQERIAKTIPGAAIEVEPAGPGHFEITVTSAVFEGKSRVQQQQLVYGAIADLMAGSTPPVHAIDRLQCLPS